MDAISQSVGQGGANKYNDVMMVQLLLHENLRANPKYTRKLLGIDGICGTKTKDAIAWFQNNVEGMNPATRVVSPTGSTFKLLTGQKPGGSPVPEQEEEWSYYADSVYKRDTWRLPAGVKKWLGKVPTHNIEVGMFPSNIVDQGRRLHFYAWKTLDMRNTAGSWYYPAHTTAALGGWYERPTSLNSVKAEHNLKTDWISVLGNDSGAKGIAAMNLGMNAYMFHFVMKKGWNIRHAKSEAKRRLHQEGKQILELVSALASHSSGIKGVRPKGNSVSLELSQLDWKGFVQQLDDIANGRFPKANSPTGGSDVVSVDELIKDGSGSVIGKVKYF